MLFVKMSKLAFFSETDWTIFDDKDWKDQKVQQSN